MSVTPYPICFRSTCIYLILYISDTINFTYQQQQNWQNIIEWHAEHINHTFTPSYRGIMKKDRTDICLKNKTKRYRSFGFTLPTFSGKVNILATWIGTATSSILKLGSGEMTVLPEKSTRFPDKLPLNRPKRTSKWKTLIEKVDFKMLSARRAH